MDAIIVFAALTFCAAVITVVMFIRRGDTDFKQTKEHLVNVLAEKEVQKKDFEALSATFQETKSSNDNLRSSYMNLKVNVDELKVVCEESRQLNVKMQEMIKGNAEEIKSVRSRYKVLRDKYVELWKENDRLDRNLERVKNKMPIELNVNLIERPKELKRAPKTMSPISEPPKAPPPPPQTSNQRPWGISGVLRSKFTQDKSPLSDMDLAKERLLQQQRETLDQARKVSTISEENVAYIIPEKEDIRYENGTYEAILPSGNQEMLGVVAKQLEELS